MLERVKVSRQVAERLKLGQSVEPESFDSVTVFFSDVVKFTQLAARCTAFQVRKRTLNYVNLLSAVGVGAVFIHHPGPSTCSLIVHIFFEQG